MILLKVLSNWNPHQIEVLLSSLSPNLLIQYSLQQVEEYPHLEKVDYL
jgi:hypothetical protein